MGEGAEDVREGVRMFKGMVEWERFSCCFDCRVPQVICKSFEVNAANGGWRKMSNGRCQFEGVLIPLTISIWVRWMEEFENYVVKRMKLGGRVREGEEVGITKIMWWLGLKKRWGGVEGTNLYSIVLEFLEEKRVI